MHKHTMRRNVGSEKATEKLIKSPSAADGRVSMETPFRFEVASTTRIGRSLFRNRSRLSGAHWRPARLQQGLKGGDVAWCSVSRGACQHFFQRN